MDIYQLQAWLNFILPLIAAVGYTIRIVIGIRNNDTNTYRVMLPLFLLMSMWMALIYLFNITNMWKLLSPDHEEYSAIYVRPFFTGLGTVLVIASWVHPEIHPLLKKIRRCPWTIWTWLKLKKR